MFGESLNPIGTCYDATSFQALFGRRPPRESLTVCHGILTTQSGKKITHAWIECSGLAYDCVYGLTMPVSTYRMNHSVEFVVEYTRDEFIRQYAIYDYPGPWHKVLIDHQKKIGKGDPPSRKCLVEAEIKERMDTIILSIAYWTSNVPKDATCVQVGEFKVLMR